MSYIAVIQRLSDGEIRRCPQTMDWDDGDDQGLGSDLFWWTEGNLGCDCNRGNFFARAAGEPDPDVPCGESLYRVIEFELPDGRHIPCDSVPA